jgi:hypothetical protein
MESMSVRLGMDSAICSGRLYRKLAHVQQEAFSGSHAQIAAWRYLER